MPRKQLHNCPNFIESKLLCAPKRFILSLLCEFALVLYRNRTDLGNMIDIFSLISIEELGMGRNFGGLDMI